MQRRLWFLGVVVALTSSAWAEFELPSGGRSADTDTQQRRPWDLSIRTFFGYNDNVQVVPDDSFFSGNSEDFSMGATLTGVYRPIQEDGFVVGLTLQATHLLHLQNTHGGDGSSSDYDMTTAAPGVFVMFNYEVFDIPVTKTLTYTFRFEEGRDIEAIGLESHAIGVNCALHLRPDFDLILAYVHGWDDYDVTFPDPELDDRDGQRDSISVTGKYTWDRGLRNVAVTYTFVHNDAEGRNFDYDSHGIRGRIESHLIASLWGALELGYSYGDYRGFVSGFVPPPGRERQESLNVSLQLIYVVSEKWSVDFFYQFSQQMANTDQFESETHIVGGGVTFRF